MEEHVKHLKFVLQKIQNGQAYVNQTKTNFANLEMNFLGHVLVKEAVKPNLEKVGFIKEW
jgi:hypothetical protein